MSRYSKREYVEEQIAGKRVGQAGHGDFLQGWLRWEKAPPECGSRLLGPQYPVWLSATNCRPGLIRTRSTSPDKEQFQKTVVNLMTHLAFSRVLSEDCQNAVTSLR